MLFFHFFYFLFFILISKVLHEGNALRKEADLVREADELWYHLLMSGDRIKLKQHAILNIDFLMTMVKGVSISYLRSILELVRSQMLDWEIELLYNMTKQSVDVVSQDANQFACEILVWLKPFCNFTPSTSSSSLTAATNTICENETNSSQDNSLNTFINDTVNWCNSLSNPMLIPSNTWLKLPLPPQVAVITCPWNSITRAVSTPDSQNLVACEGKFLHFYNLPSKSLIKSIEGITFKKCLI